MLDRLAALRAAPTGDPRAERPGDLAAALAVGGAPAWAAADVVADLAVTAPEAAARFEPLLRDRLGDPGSRLAAARALARLGVPTAELAEPLGRGLTDYAGRFALSIILELHAVETIPYLRNAPAADED